MANKSGNQDGDNVVPLKRGGGRPPFRWTAEIEQYIWRHMIAGMSLRAIVQLARDEDYKGSAFPSYDTIMARIQEDREFSDSYARAKDLQQELLAEDLVDIIDGRHPDFANADLAQRKASVEERKWLMGKLRRKKWGEVKVTEITGKDGTPLIQPQVINTRDMTPEAQAALYQALQFVVAQESAEDITTTEEKPDE